LQCDGYLTIRQRADDLPAEIRMGRGFELSGRIMGLPAGIAPVVCRLVFRSPRMDGLVDFDRKRIALQGSGSARSFSFSHLPACAADLIVAGQDFPVEIDANQTDLAYTLAPKTAAESPSPRTVRIQFQGEAGEPPPTGSLEIIRRLGVESPHPLAFSTELISVRGDTAEFSVTAPTEITIRPEKLIGYWFADVKSLVPLSADPLVLTIPLTPAGAIQGRMLDHDGHPVDSVSFACIRVHPGGSLETRGQLIKAQLEESVGMDGHFTATPLPFGSRYLIVARRGLNFTVSPAVLVDSRHPFPEIEIQQAGGVTVVGKVIDAGGHSIPHLRIRCIYDPGLGPACQFSLPEIVTDADGQFSFDHLNLDAPGHYDLLLESRPTSGHARFQLDRRTSLPLVIKTIESPRPEDQSAIATVARYAGN